MTIVSVTELSPHLEKLLQQRRGLPFADRRIHVRHMVTGRPGKEPHAGFHGAALGIGGAVIEPPDSRQRNRAGAYADFEIDKADREAGKKITIPMLALWGDAGIASAAATPLDTWKKWATNVSGAPVDAGHFLTEENPDATAKALQEFFLS